MVIYAYLLVLMMGGVAYGMEELQGESLLNDWELVAGEKIDSTADEQSASEPHYQPILANTNDVASTVITWSHIAGMHFKRKKEQVAANRETMKKEARNCSQSYLKGYLYEALQRYGLDTSFSSLPMIRKMPVSDEYYPIADKEKRIASVRIGDVDDGKGCYLFVGEKDNILEAHTWNAILQNKAVVVNETIPVWVRPSPNVPCTIQPMKFVMVSPEHEYDCGVFLQRLKRDFIATHLRGNLDKDHPYNNIPVYRVKEDESFEMRGYLKDIQTIEDKLDLSLDNYTLGGIELDNEGKVRKYEYDAVILGRPQDGQLYHKLLHFLKKNKTN
jgi:hypothetical protein